MFRVAPFRCCEIPNHDGERPRNECCICGSLGVLFEAMHPQYRSSSCFDNDLCSDVQRLTYMCSTLTQEKVIVGFQLSLLLSTMVR